MASLELAPLFLGFPWFLWKLPWLAPALLLRQRLVVWELEPALTPVLFLGFLGNPAWWETDRGGMIVACAAGRPLAVDDVVEHELRRTTRIQPCRTETSTPRAVQVA